MKSVRALCVWPLLAAVLVSGSCGSNDDSTSVGAPITTPQPGMTGGGTPGGGMTAGTTPTSPTGGGTTGGVGMQAGTGGTAGGTPAGGTITSVIVESKPCEKKVRSAGRTVPDFMIVLDRSQSMKPDCTSRDPFLSYDCRPNMVDCNAAPHMGTTVCGGTMPSPLDRWNPAVAAIKSLTQMFETKVNFGLTVFPGPFQGTGVAAQCTTGTQRVPVGLSSATAIASELDKTAPGGRTPTGPTLVEVLNQIKGKKVSPDTQLPPQYVLLVTDGSPTCPGQATTMNQEAHQATIAAIDELAKIGVKTFVIGYDASVNPELAAQLTEYAKHGGTNNFFAVQDGPSLVAQFTSITAVVAECSYLLDKKPDDKNFVLVELDGDKLNLDDPNGWVIDDRNVTIQGDACAKLRDGSKPHTLAVTVECVSQIPM